ncbi:MAG: transposase [Cytophagaceae bacterium]|nr:transposase [Cytophagaceae bacterium]
MPALPSKYVAVMDNASFHKRTDTLNAIRTQGHDVLFLHPYSPDLNPIEKKWAQAKSIRKNTDAIRINFFKLICCEYL